jgi:molecular chaperone HscB
LVTIFSSTSSNKVNYFELYDLPLSFSLDEAKVKSKFYELSKKFHPDFYINESAEKQQEILELSTLNNEAFQVLSNPLKRIPYILQLKGLMEEEGQYQLPQDFLMEMMEVNEALMDLEFEADPVVLEQITAKVGEMEKVLFDELKQFILGFDVANAADQQSLLLKIKDIWYRQKYLLRIRESLNRFASR